MRIPDMDRGASNRGYFGESVPVLETTRYRLFEGLTALARKEDGAWENLARRMRRLEDLIEKHGRES